MKELSIEEKAKAYDGNYKAYTELINRLEDVKKAIKKQNYGIAMDILYKPYPEYQITTSPELKESEDEKIRKQIRNFISYAETCGENKIRWIAWLEKQGKQKPAKVESITEGLKTEFQKQVSYLIASVLKKEHEYTIGYVTWVAQSLLGYAKNELEQKPVEDLNEALQRRFSSGDKENIKCV